jgi:hypothetical protein
MIPIYETPTIELLNEFLTYDPATGIFIWKRRDRKYFKSGRDHNAWNTLYSGKSAGGSRKDGYIRIRILANAYYAHRLAWKVHAGKDTELYIDHINMNPSDNRIANLRCSLHRENRRNSKLSKSNTTGFKGTSRNKKNGKYIARIQDNNKHLHLGVFSTAEEAHAAYCKAATNLFGEFANFG